MTIEERALPLGLAPSHIYANLSYDWQTGWRLTVGCDDQASAEWGPRASYDALSSEEALQVAVEELGRLLGLA